MRIKSLLLGGGVMTTIAMAMIERAGTSSAPPWFVPRQYYPTRTNFYDMGGRRGGSLAHRKWRKLRRSGRR